MRILAILVLSLAANAGASAVSFAPCPSSSEQPPGARCGQVRVPENRALKAGRQISLNVVVLPARSAAGHSDPVFGIAGGPGSAATRLATSYPRLYEALQADHDIVLVDLRGTGESHPLVCVNTDPAYLMKSPERVFDNLPDNTALTACRDRLVKDADLKRYTESDAAADLDNVRQALGYGRINVLAISFGTRTALEYLRRYESRVRAIALSGVVSPSWVTGLTSARESQNALKRLFEFCQADSTCNGAFPKLASDFDAVMAALARGPATPTLPIGSGIPALKLTITRAAFARELLQLLQHREDWALLPLAIHSAAVRDFLPFAGLSLKLELTRNARADGMAMSAICAQDAASLTPPAIAAATKGTFLRDDDAQFFKRACTIWPRAAKDETASTPVRAATPALLVSGALDPITPSGYAAEVARTLPNSLHVLHANVAHVPANPCVNGLIVSFFKTGSTAGLDTGCAAKFPPIKFATSLQ